MEICWRKLINTIFEAGKTKEHFILLILIELNKLDGSLPANPVNDRRIANALTLKSTFCLP